MYRFHVILLFRITFRYLTESLFGIGILFMVTCVYTNMKPNLSNIAIFILIEQNVSYVIQ